MKCQECGDEIEEVVRVKVGKKTMKLCEACAETHEQDEEVAAQAENSMRSMMEYKGR
jgi:hypothetical protein